MISAATTIFVSATNYRRVLNSSGRKPRAARRIKETKDEEAEGSSEIFRTGSLIVRGFFALATNRVLPLTSILLVVAIWLGIAREFSGERPFLGNGA